MVIDYQCFVTKWAFFRNRLSIFMGNYTPGVCTPPLWMKAYHKMLHTFHGVKWTVDTPLDFLIDHFILCSFSRLPSGYVLTIHPR